MNTECGNVSHPDGPWHPATPLPANSRWWQRRPVAVRRYENNVRDWGCGCDRSETTHYIEDCPLDGEG